jgi:hypothetical protein
MGSRENQFHQSISEHGTQKSLAVLKNLRWVREHVLKKLMHASLDIFKG